MKAAVRSELDCEETEALGTGHGKGEGLDENIDGMVGTSEVGREIEERHDIERRRGMPGIGTGVTDLEVRGRQAECSGSRFDGVLGLVVGKFEPCAGPAVDNSWLQVQSTTFVSRRHQTGSRHLCVRNSNI